MKQDKLIKAAKKAGFILDKFETEAYAPNVSIPNRKRDDVFPSLIKFAEIIEELILASQAQPTPSQSVERVEFEKWYINNYLQHYSPEFKKDSFAKDINGKYKWLELQGAFESFEYGASLYTKPQPTSQDVLEYAERLEVALKACMFDCNTGDPIGIAVDALASRAQLSKPQPTPSQSEPVAYLLRIDCEGDVYIHIPCKDENAVWQAIKEFIADEDSEEDSQHYIDFVLDGENWNGDSCQYHFEIGSWTLYKLNCDLYTKPQPTSQDARYDRLMQAFHINMIRAYPTKSHAEITEAINAAMKASKE